VAIGLAQFAAPVRLIAVHLAVVDRPVLVSQACSAGEHAILELTLVDVAESVGQLSRTLGAPVAKRAFQARAPRYAGYALAGELGSFEITFVPLAADAVEAALALETAAHELAVILATIGVDELALAVEFAVLELALVSAAGTGTLAAALQVATFERALV